LTDSFAASSAAPAPRPGIMLTMVLATKVVP
jgi:hypothetical protein